MNVYFIGLEKTGKTTMLNIFKKNFKTKEEIIPNSLKKLKQKYNLNEKPLKNILDNKLTLEAQIHFAIDWIKIFEQSNDIIIYDRSFIDIIYYTKSYKHNILAEILELYFIKKIYNEKDKYIFFPVNYEILNNAIKDNAWYRASTNTKYSQKLFRQELFFKLLKKLNIKYHILKTIKLEDRKKEILSIISH